ncbi:glycoside hydrolase domain-containing protein [Candidatus Latescibacterota bacterium]
MPGNAVPDVLRLDSARGEIVSGQVVYTPGETVSEAAFHFTDLRNSDTGDVIPASAAQVRWVRYIDVQKNSSRIPQNELEIIAPNPMPDPFWDTKTLPVKVGTFSILDNSVYIAFKSQPLWIEITVPRNIQPGVYTGQISVSGASKPAVLPIKLNIRDFQMPEERHVSSITWWNLQSRGMQEVEPYSDKYWNRLRHFAEFSVKHRQTDAGLAPITIIEEKGSEETGYRYDTGKLEKYAETVFIAGMECLHLHSLGRLSESASISGVGRGVLDRSRHVLPRDDAFRRLPALGEMISRRGWEGKIAVGISDEPFMHNEESYAEVAARIHEIAPNVMIAEAVEAEYLGELDIYCPKINHLHMWYPTYKKHQAAGAKLWFYTSRIPIGRYPNRFIDSSLLKMRVQFWMLYLFDLDGYLFWALNSSYTDDPFSQEAVGRNSPLGNPVIAYPDSDGEHLLGSLRFSAHRDGLEDYEYMWTLEDRLQQLKENIGEDANWLDPRQRSLELCRRVVWEFSEYTRDPELMLEVRSQIADEIEALDNGPLLYVQTSPPEGTIFPEGPRNLGIRGLVAPGSKVTINGDPVDDIRQSGYFRRYHFLLDSEQEVKIEVEYNGQKRSVVRTFRMVE